MQKYPQKYENLFMYSYIHNWSLQPFSQNYDLGTYVVCVNFIKTLNDRYSRSFL